MKFRHAIPPAVFARKIHQKVAARSGMVCYPFSKTILPTVRSEITKNVEIIMNGSKSVKLF